MGKYKVLTINIISDDNSRMEFEYGLEKYGSNGSKGKWYTGCRSK